MLNPVELSFDDFNVRCTFRFTTICLKPARKLKKAVYCLVPLFYRLPCSVLAIGKETCSKTDKAQFGK